jgi:hypothetical protein
MLTKLKRTSLMRQIVNCTNKCFIALGTSKVEPWTFSIDIRYESRHAWFPRHL